MKNIIQNVKAFFFAISKFKRPVNKESDSTILTILDKDCVRVGNNMFYDLGNTQLEIRYSDIQLCRYQQFYQTDEIYLAKVVELRPSFKMLMMLYHWMIKQQNLQEQRNHLDYINDLDALKKDI